MQICGPVAKQLASKGQQFFTFVIGGSSSCYTPSMNFMVPPVTELLQVSFRYVT